MLISSTIPNMFNGVSQQPPTLRHTSQGEIQENCYPTIAAGLRKRPPTEHLAKIRVGTSSDAYIHLINRDTVERYVVVVMNGALEVYDIAGNAKTVTFPDGTAYLNCTTPREEFSLVTVADYTFVVNKTKVTAMAVTLSGATLTGTVQKFSDLTGTPAINSVYKILGDNTNQFDDYYVLKAHATLSNWTETIAPSTKLGFDATTMPFQLIRNGDGTFTFSKVTWDARLVGSDISNPQPSFIGTKIGGVFFHRNRLGFLADEGIIMSRSGMFFNFWAKSVTAVLDDDPIDITASHSKVSILRSVIPFNKTLLLFSDQTQFQLNGGDVLTPKSASTDIVTEFESSSICKPAALGKAVYFAVTKGSATGIREYFVDVNTFANDAADVTAHVPSYVPTNVFKIAASSNENVVFALSTTERNAIYVYKVYWGATEKVQSAWGKFTFDAGEVILNCDFVGTDVYLLIQRADGIFLELMHLQEFLGDTGFDFLIHLDRKKSLTGVYSSGTGLTTWTLPYIDAGDMVVILGPSFPTNKGTRLTTTRPSSTTIAAIGNYSAYPCVVGRNYTQRYRFSEIYVRDGKGLAVIGNRLKLKRMHLTYADTGYFQVKVTPLARTTNTYDCTPFVLGSTTAVLGTPTIASGKFTFPVRTSNVGVAIDIENTTYLPSTFQSAEWDGEYVPKTQRT